MKILVIDDSADFRQLLRIMLLQYMPGAEIEEYDPVEQGPPPPGFDWSAYDLLFLDYQLGMEEDGLDWLKRYGAGGLPPTVMLTARGDEYVALQAMKLGAAEYCNKRDLSPGRLEALVSAALGDSTERQAAEQDARQKAASIVDDIQRKNRPAAEAATDSGYRLIRLIGKGPMSQVYLAERRPEGLSLVLKILDLEKTKNPSWAVRFRREAELIAGLQSPFVVKIHEHDTTQRYAFIAMEFFPRGDLKQRMEIKIDPNMAFNYAIHIAYGLEAIHGIDIVHRDLKPANIMFRGDDSLALADFGISKKIDGELENEITGAGQILGTPYYISPEQCRSRPADTRADIYSAGVILYELLTGDKPYRGRTAATVMSDHVSGDIPQLPASLAVYQDIIERCLAKEPGDRYRDAADLISVLEQAERLSRP